MFYTEIKWQYNVALFDKNCVLKCHNASLKPHYITVEAKCKKILEGILNRSALNGMKVDTERSGCF